MITEGWRKNIKDTIIDQVLVSVGSLKQLKIAYPNYFADVSDFVAKVRSIEDGI